QATPVRLPVPPLLVISDRLQAPRRLEEVAAASFAGGCRWFSLREKDLPSAQRQILLGALVALGRRWGATVTVHEDVDAAVGAGAHGVAVMGEVMRAADPQAAVARLLRTIRPSPDG